MAKLTIDQALQQGVAAHKAGQVQEADGEPLETSNAALEEKQQKPNILDSLKLGQAIRLAKKKAKDGAPGQAKRIYQDILNKFPKNKRARDGIKALAGSPDGKASIVQDPPQDQLQSLINLYNQGQFQQALERVQTLVQQFSTSAILFNIQGAVLQGLGQIDRSIDAYKKAIAIKPDDADAYYNIGVTLQDQGKLEEAIEAYNNALAIKPDDADAYYNMGVTLKDQGKLEEAIEAYNKTLAIKPDFAEAYNNMGNALRDQGKLEEAIKAYNKTLAIKPDFAEAYNNMGNALRDQGKLEEAIKAYNKTLAIKPDFAEAARNLVKLPLGSIGKKTISELDKNLSSVRTKIYDQSQRLFFEANLLSHKGKYDDAFKVFVDANHIAASQEFVSPVKSLEEKYDSAGKRIRSWSLNPQSQGGNSIKQLFLLGPSRSGKSTLEKLLISSPNVCPMFESINLNAINETEIQQGQTKQLNLADIFYKDEESLLSAGHNVVTSTSPESIFHIDRLIDRFTNSYYILVKRDRADIASEIFVTEYDKGNSYSYDNISIMNYLDTYEAIWEEIKHKASQRTLEISFEEILTKPQEMVEKISQLTAVNFQVDNKPSHSIKNLISPFREHYALEFKTPIN